MVLFCLCLGRRQRKAKAKAAAAKNSHPLGTHVQNIALETQRAYAHLTRQSIFYMFVAEFLFCIISLPVQILYASSDSYYALQSDDVWYQDKMFHPIRHHF